MLHLVLFYIKMTILINFNFDSNRTTLIFSGICDKNASSDRSILYLIYAITNEIFVI